MCVVEGVPVETLVERRDTTPERLHVFDDAFVVFAGFVVYGAGRGERQVRLQVAERRGEIVQVIRHQAAVAELVRRGRIDREQELGDVARLRERVHFHVD